MRTIKFRGKRVDNGEWVYGDFYRNQLPNRIKHYITKMKKLYGVEEFEVIPETVGQFTGLTDKNGVEIYEGDVVKWTNVDHYWEAIISTVANNKSNTLYAVETFHNCTSDEEENIYTYERSDSRCGVRNELEYLCKNTFVIGNIHDNFELLNK